MGEIADSIISGEFDYITGEYIGEPCGYPRTYEVDEDSAYAKLKKLKRQKSKNKVKKMKKIEKSNIFD